MSTYFLAQAPQVSIRVITASLACCTLEIESAIARGELVPLPDSGQVDDTLVSVFVIAGTVTDALLPSVLEVIKRSPKSQVMSFGACATSGGPYWDSPPVTKGIDQFVDVAIYVAGCPPRPEAFVEALRELSRVGSDEVTV